MTFNITLWLIVALLTAVIALFFCVWYIRKVLARLLFVGENLKDLVDLLTTYREHLKGIYQLEQYYGDQDLKNLIEHTNSILEVLEDDYSSIYLLTEEPPEQEEEEEIYAEEEVDEKNVFYAGTRTGNS
tara:strand:- start:138 stop:524 length:387 start_codon:yes stop_codon:yes gene_type:complete